MLKKSISVFLAILLFATVTACNQKPEPPAAPANTQAAAPTNTPAANTPATNAAPTGDVFTMKVTNMYSPEMPETIALMKFKDDLKAATNGRLAAELFPNCQLGPEEVFTDSLIKGTVDMALPGTTMAKHLPTVAIGEWPFLFKDWQHARRIFTGPIGQKAFEGIVEKVGVRAFGFTPMGFSITASTDKPITKYEDLKNRRFRIPPIAHFIEFAKAIGTNPVPNMLTEFYTSMEQKVADSCSVPYSILKSTKVFELTPYIAETNDILFTHGWYVNEKYHQKLPEDLQKILADTIKKSQNYLWDLAIETEKKDKEYMQSHGVTINAIDDTFKAKLYESRTPVHEWFFKNYPGTEALIKEIEKTN